MKKIIFNNDDFGLTNSIDLAVVELFELGIIKSATFLTTFSNFDESVKTYHKYLANTNFTMGLHFSLTAGKVQSSEFSNKYKIDEFSKYDEEILKNLEEKYILFELESQYNKLIEAGVEVSHIDSHHHVHEYKNIFNVVKKFAIEKELTIRKINDEKENWNTPKFTQEFYNVFTKNELLKILNKDNQMLEVMVHVSLKDDELNKYTSYNDERRLEYELLKNEKTYLINNYEMCNIRGEK